MFEGFFGIIIGICAIAISIAWIILPFAVFGIKQRLDTLIELQKLQIRSSTPSPRIARNRTEYELR